MQISFQKRTSNVQFVIVIKKAEGNYSAYAPDLPGCIAVGDTLEEVEQSMKEAIELTG